MKSLLLLLLALLPSTVALGQNDFKLPIENYLRPAPNAAALMKYVDYPVSYSTGVPEISIPIYTVKNRELEMPISISYHAGGTKIDEMATNVGFGWTLNCGGVVTRSVRGLPDSPGMDIKDELDIQLGYLTWITTGIADNYYDTYYYNFNGQSGEFMYNMNTQQITKITASDNIIQVNRLPGVYDQIESFTITTPDGTVYRFTEKENTTSGGFNIVSSWCLSKITAHNGTDSIVLSYAADPNWDYAGAAMMTVTFGGLIPYTQTHSPTTLYSNCKRLSSISWDTGYIELTSALDRQDQGTKSRLTAITCQDKNDNQVVKATFDNNAYFSGPRLKLKGIKIVGRGDETIDDCRFSYINETADMPTNWSYDLFGFFNATESDPLTDRTYVFDAAQTFVLGRIDHITGAYTKFIYEPNLLKTQTGWYQPIDINIGIRIAKIETYKHPANKLYTRSFEYGNSISTIDFTKVDGSWFLAEFVFDTPTTDPMNPMIPGRVIISSNSSVPGTPLESAKLFHAHVTEKQYGGTQDTLKTVFSFSTAHDMYTYCDTKGYIVGDIRIIDSDLDSDRLPGFHSFVLSVRGNPFMVHTPIVPQGYFRNVDWMFGHLLAKEVYSYKNGQYTLVEKTCNQYESADISDLAAGIYAKLMWKTSEAPSYPDGVRQFYYFNPLTFAGRMLLVSSFLTKYFESGNITEQTQYTYPKQGDRVIHGFPKTESLRINDEPVRTKQFYYPFDYADAVHMELKARNRINFPIKTELIKEGSSIASLETVFSQNGNIILPSSTFLRKSNMYSIDDRYDFKRYDAYQNPVYILRNDIIETVYIWGYNWSEPVAEIKNATYSQLQSVDNSNMVARIGAANDLLEGSPELQWLHSLRSRLPEAQVTLYTYQPLIGTRSITDPSGRTTRYEYDSANRLQQIVDEDGNILEAYEYHYRNN